MSLADQINAGPMSIQHRGNVDKSEGKMGFDQTAPGTFEVDGNGARRLDPVEYNSYSDTNGIDQDVLSTLQNSAGNPVSDLSQIDDPSRFSVEIRGGIRTSLANAIRLNEVVVNGDGTYSDGDPGEIYAPEDVQPDQNLSQPVFESINKIKAVLGENQTNALLSSVVGATVNDETDSDAAISSFANQAGLKGLEEGKAVAEAIVEDLTSALINGTASKFNLDSAEVGQFLNACSATVKTSLILRVLHGEPSVFHELASRKRYGNIR